MRGVNHPMAILQKDSNNVSIWKEKDCFETELQETAYTQKANGEETYIF